MQQPMRFAAIDLGSNSFHLLIAQITAQGFRVLTRHRQKVRLADGLDAQHQVSAEAIQRGCDCLQEFNSLLQQHQPLRVHCVATATVRKATNQREIVRAFERTLGHPIQVISGRTEAALIYRGATANLAHNQKVLVLDIGGASTEAIVGQGRHTKVLHSLDMGCVVWHNRFFNDGLITAERCRDGLAAAKQVIEPVAAQYRKYGWQRVCGASGTFRALLDIQQHQGDTQSQINAAWIKDLVQQCQQLGQFEKLAELGIREDRIAVFMGGIMILQALIEVLGIEHFELSEGALREGLVHTMSAATCLAK